MESFDGEEPPPLSMSEPKTVRNLSSSSSAFLSANQSPFFSPRTPPSIKSSSSAAAQPTSSSVSARLFGSGSAGIGPLSGEKLASQSQDSGNVSLLRRVAEGLREGAQTRKEYRSSQVDIPPPQPRPQHGKDLLSSLMPIQSFLAGVPFIVIGFRNDAGNLLRVERLSTKDITQRVKMKNYWQGGVCLAFADEVLCWLYGIVKENEDYILQFCHPFTRLELLRAHSCPSAITNHVEQL